MSEKKLLCINSNDNEDHNIHDHDHDYDDDYENDDNKKKICIRRPPTLRRQKAGLGNCYLINTNEVKDLCFEDLNN